MLSVKILALYDQYVTVQPMWTLRSLVSGCAAACLVLCRSFQALGLGGLGFSLGFERLHYMLDTAFDGDQLSHRFMKVGMGVLVLTQHETR